jgi:hypothetical protein
MEERQVAASRKDTAVSVVSLAAHYALFELEPWKLQENVDVLL